MSNNFVMMRLIYVLFFLPAIVFGQQNITGIVSDAKTKHAIPLATVYINGTTVGTTTDNEGAFSISVTSIPCQIVISHIGYEPKVLSVENLNETHKKVELFQRLVQMDEVNVKGKNLRAKNIDEFKMWFLGFDYWGKNAILLNDEVLSFSRDRKKWGMKIIPEIQDGKSIFLSDKSWVSGDVEWAKDSSEIFMNRAINLKASAKEPLTVNLPLLGYTLQIELVDFIVQYASENGGLQTSFLGYYYFIPYKTEREKDLKKFEKNRQKAYFNSSQHFCRSLYDKKLQESGYQLFEQIIDSISKQKLYKEFIIDEYLNYIENDELQIKGLNNKHFYLFYYGNSKGEPKDLTTQKPWVPIQSEIYFLSDTCLIRSNGIIPNNSIVFSGAISEKKVGSMLPEDYKINDK
ncbi:MAG: hypothetical protein CVU00_05600 [Bacteroidetes bacterium HGW-Bacteroidetes-17]|jgi:hypothetical protein|nr:MAG: hypothetical protein CVU00_05600 [Bacteroidetes bacterium HGW-Bacteroidetes-17]